MKPTTPPNVPDIPTDPTWAASALGWCKNFPFPNTKAKGDALELFCRHVIFPKMFPGITMDDIELVSQSRDKLRGRGQDSIDLNVNVRHHGQFWAVIVKNENTPFDYLMAEGYTRAFERRKPIVGYTDMMVIALGGFTSGAIEVLDDVAALTHDYYSLKHQRIDVTVRKLRSLRDRNNPASKEPRKVLMPHQKRAIDRLCASAEPRMQIHYATATGKTLIAARFAKRLKSQRIIGFEPTIQMVGQQGLNYQRELPSHRLMCVCSSQPVVRGSALGVQTTTNPAEIRDFVSEPGPFILMTTLQSVKKVIEALNLPRQPPFERFDLGLLDEAHNNAVQALQSRGEPAAYAKPLYDKYVPIERRVGFTATPKFVTQALMDKALAKGQPLAPVCMTDMKLFGPVIAEYPLMQAIKEKRVSNFDVIVAVLDPSYVDPISGKLFRDELVRHIERGRQVHHYTARFGNVNVPTSMLSASDEAKIQFFLSQCAYGEAYLTFHNRKDSAYETEKWLNLLAAERGLNVRTQTVIDKSTPDERAYALDLMENKHPDALHVIFNCDVFSEGVDTPALDGVCYFDPRRSTVSIGQGNGRALRWQLDAQGNPKIAKILVPVPVPDTVTAEDFIRGTPFANLWAVTAAMKHLGVVFSDPIWSYTSSASPIKRVPHNTPNLHVLIPEAYDHVLLRSILGHTIQNGPNVALTDAEIVDRYITFVTKYKRLPRRNSSTSLVEQAENALTRQFESLDEDCKRAFYDGEEDDDAAVA